MEHLSFNKLTVPIYIIGAGTVGKALAVCLQHSGRKVTLVRGSVDEGPAYQETIRLKIKGGPDLEEILKVDTLANLGTIRGLVALTNKSFGNARLAEKLRDKAKKIPVVLLQNGLGIEAPFLENGFEEVYRCVLFLSSQNEVENTVAYKSVAASPIGVIRNQTTELNEIVKALNNPLFPFRAEPGIQEIIWEKVIANCVFNSICPLLETDNGIFHRDTQVFALAKDVIRECVAVAGEKGIKLNPLKIEQLCLKISKGSDGQLISTLQDIQNKRETEIETLNLEVARIADTLKKGYLVSKTRLLGELIKQKSEIFRS